MSAPDRPVDDSHQAAVRAPRAAAAHPAAGQGPLDGQPGGDGGQVEPGADPPPGLAVDRGRVGPAGAAQGQGLDRVLDEGGE
jgi:hypothetical protein